MLKEQKRNLLKKAAGQIRKVAERTEEKSFSVGGFYRPKKPVVKE